MEEAIAGCNELENQIGIETGVLGPHGDIWPVSCNELENPIGIETRTVDTEEGI